MFKAIIVENDLLQIRTLKKMIREHCPQIEVMDEIRDLRSSQKIISQQQPDLVFFDLSIKNGQVFEMLDKIMPLDFELIFTSKNDQHSLKAIKYAALDYLLKPFNVADVQAAGQKAIQKITSKYVTRQLDMILSNIKDQPNGHQRKVAIPTVEGYVFINMFDIVRCEANGAYTTIYTSKKEKIIASRNIKEYEEMFPKNQFFRVHNSHLVNVNRILRYNKGRGGTLTMEDGTSIEVASRRRNEFINLFQ